MMQVNSVWGERFSIAKLKSDVCYNIHAGAQGKLDKYGDATTSFGMSKRVMQLLEDAKAVGIKIVIHVPQ